MTMEIETAEAVAALRAAVKECQDVIDLADSEPDETLKGRGYASVLNVMEDMVRILNNGLRRLGEAPVLPVSDEPEVTPDPEPDPTPQPEAGVEAEPEVIEPPAAIADLIREDTPYGEQATELLKRYTSLTNKIMLPGVASNADRSLHSRLHGALDWIKRHAVEVVG